MTAARPGTGRSAEVSEALAATVSSGTTPSAVQTRPCSRLEQHTVRVGHDVPQPRVSKHGLLHTGLRAGSNQEAESADNNGEVQPQGSHFDTDKHSVVLLLNECV